MSENPLSGDLLPKSPKMEAALLLKDIQTPEGKLRVMQDPSVSDEIKLVLLKQTSTMRQEVEAILETTSSLKEWMTELLAMPKGWGKQIRARVHKEFSKGTDAFMSFLNHCAELDLTTLSLQSATNKGEATADAKAFLAPLDLENAIVTAALDEIQKDKEKIHEILAIIQESKELKDGPWIDMSSAAVPKPSVRTERYGESVRRWLKNHSNDFGGLKSGFDELTREIFGPGKEAFLTKGTTGAFRALGAEFKEAFVNTDTVNFLAATPGEYLPLFSSLRYNSFSADVDSPDFTERDIIDGVRKHIKKFTGATQLVVTVSSVQRMGGKRIDIEKVCDDLRALQQELEPDTPEIHIWVDASQDTRIIRNADAVFYSKRTGSMVVIDKDRYPQTELDDFVEAARMRSGYDDRQAAETLASLHSLLSGKRASLNELVHNSNVWLSQESSVDQQIVDAKAFISQSPILSKNLRLIAPDPDPESTDMLLRLESVYPGAVDMIALQRELRKRRVDVGTFTLKALSSEDGQTLKDLRSALDSPDVDAEDAVALIRKFQSAHKDRIAWSLLPADDFKELTKKQVLDRFEKAVQAHEFLRLHLNDLDSPQRLTMFLAQTEKALEALQKRHVPHPDNSDRKSRPKRKQSLGSR